MNIKSYFRTFSFRTGLILFLGLSATLIVIRIFFYKQSVDNAYADIQGTLLTHETVISESMAAYDAVYVRELINRIIEETKDKNLLLAFESEDLKSGNLPDLPKLRQTGQWQEAYITREDGEQTHAYGKIIKYSQRSRLFLGYNLQRIDTLKTTLLKVLIGNILLSFALSFALSTLVVLVLNRSLARINYTCQQVMNGDLGHRIRVSSDFDQFDRLGGNINRMLDWINALLDTVKDSSNAIAHDMRTPLSRHRLELRAILDSPGLAPDMRDKLLATIEHIDRLADMFDNILNIAKAESRTSTELFEPVNLATVVADILDFYAPMIEAKSIALEQHTPSNVTAVMGDKQLLSQAFMNLIDNAVKYAPAGSHVSVSLTRDSKAIRFEVSDNGHGIPSDMLEKAKERFFRLDKSRNTDGTGLGLSLVQAVMKLHQGELILEDNTPGLKASLVFSV